MNRKFYKIMCLKIIFFIIIILENCNGQTENNLEKTEDDKIWQMLIENNKNRTETIPLIDENDEIVIPEVVNLINETSSNSSDLNKQDNFIDKNYSDPFEHQNNTDDDSSENLLINSGKSDGIINIENKNDTDFVKSVLKIFENSSNTENSNDDNLNQNDAPYNYQKYYNDKIELLDEIDLSFATLLRSKGGHHSSKLYLHNKNDGTRIVEDPSYIETIIKKPEPGQRSLVIIFDSTGSMINDLEQLTEGAEAIISEITQRENNPIYNYIFVPFRDPYVGPKLVTQDLNRLLTELRNLPLFGGGDCPESAIGGINLALESILPKSFIFVFTDATAKDFGLDKATIDLVQKHQATLTFLLTGFCKSKKSEGYHVYEKLAALSNGQVFNIQKQNIREVLDSVRSSLDKDLVPIDYVYSKDSGTHSIDVPVDYNLKELTVSVAGENPNITITDPNEVKRTDFNELLNLSNLKVVNVQDPTPGKWNVETKADSEHSVKLTALSNLNFDFGFSLDEPENMSETSLNPTKEIPNILSISPSDDNVIQNLTFVELVPADYNSDEIEPKIKKLWLKNMGSNGNSENPSIYSTESFEPPLEMFKIYVEGYDAKGNPLRHLLSTAIKAVDGEKSKISTPNNYVEIVEGTNNKIQCDIHTIIPATVLWMDNKKELHKIDELSERGKHSTFFTINNTRLEDAGTYVCMVENEYGLNEQIITVIVKEHIIPLNVKLMEPYMVARENDVDYQISCYVSPAKNVNYTWKFEQSEIKNNSNFEISLDNLLIKKINRKNRGNYTCVANNGRTSGNDTAFFDVLYEAEILRPEDEWHTVNIGENLQLDCETDGGPSPTIQWLSPEESNLRFENTSIQNFTVSVGGTYSCKVSNGIGSEKSKNFYIDVREKPKIYNIIPTNKSDKILQTVPNEDNERKYKILEGFTGSFICNATGNPEPLYRWIKKEEQEESEEEIIFSDDEVLVIDDAIVSDTGNYVCIAENQIGQDMQSLNLYVVVPPKMKSIEDVVIMLEAGQNVSLNCDVTGIPFPKISWSLNNNSLDENDNYYSFENVSLNFRARLKDSGVYECLAQNEGGHTIKKVVLLVYVPPSIYPPNDEVIDTIINYEAIIYCGAGGYPKPSISWSKNGIPIQNNERINSNNEWNKLILSNVTLSDEGTYTCQAQNQHGVAQKNFYLNIQHEPKITTDLPATIKLLPSESVSLNCGADGNPSPDVFWRKDQQVILTGEKISILTLNNSGDRNITGIYECLTQNAVGSNQQFVEVIGIGKPTVDENQMNMRNKTILTSLNEDIELICPINNAVKYRWFKNGEEMIEEKERELWLYYVAWNDHGNYTCVGENEAGSTEYTQEVVVMTTPQFPDVSNESTNGSNDDDEEIERKPKPKNIELKLGENVTLKCAPQGYPEPEIEWRKGSNVLSHDPELHLRNIQIAHSGEYICRAKNIFGENELTYNINVQVPPTSQVPKDNWLELSPNEDLKLECNLIGNPWPSIYWTKNGVNLTEFQEVFEIKDPQIEDSGEYKCVGTNFLGEEEIVFHVDVLAPPKFISPNNEIKIKEQDNLELECVVIANPLPIVAWSFNNKVIWSTSSIPTIDGEEIVYTDPNGNPIFYLYPNETISNEIPNTGQYGKIVKKEHILKALLVIEDPKKKKSGLYKCHSINSLGSQEQDFHVQINYPPVLKGNEIDKKPIVNVTVLEDLPLILYCPWHGNPPPKITWTKNNQPVQQYDTTLSKDMKTLTVFHANLNQHSGEFSCTAINELGTKEKSFFVKILVPPKFEINNEILEENIIPYTHVIGQKTVLECPVTGNPPPTIFWLQQNDNEKQDSDFEIVKTNSPQLILDDIKSSGIYSCYANNSLGYIEKKYSVEVQKIPFINSDTPNQQTFKEYQTITLHCPAEGTPKPIISWYKDGRSVEEIMLNAQFSYDKTILKIPNARKEYSGTYTCFATNPVGESRRDTEIVVKTPVIWSDWDLWTPCSKSCGTGTKSRRRRCIKLNGEPASDENECKGANYESEMCEMLPCPINGNWGNWTQWTSCSKSCKNVNDTFKPIRRRYRQCNSPKPMYGGKHCVGQDYEEEICNTVYCPVNGGWSDWTSWSPCSVTCGTGKKERYRTCNNPVPAYGGSSCKGRGSDVTYCFPNACPVNGGWSEWSAWSECSQTCGTGLKKRSRTCTNPVPQNGGQDCIGENMEIARCRKQKCPNSSLLKSLHNIKNFFGPAAEYDAQNLHFQDNSEEYDQVVFPQEPQYQYALGSNSRINAPPLNTGEQTREYTNPEGMKVVVTLKNYKPIDKDIKELSLYPGIAPFRIQRINPCPFGFEMDENNQCKDVDECQMGSVCEENESCKNIDGGFVCSCSNGFHFDNKKGKCVDTDECSDERFNDCSHVCHNTVGSYTCSCPDTYMLNPDDKSCGPDPLYSGDGFMSDFAFINLTTDENECFEGYHRVNGVCQDIDECTDNEHDCGYEQKCLNTRGSYLCVPTPCPENYIKDERSELCILMCNKNIKCESGANVAEILTYTILPLDKFILSEPFHALLSYDLNRNVLTDTEYILERTKDSKLFKLEKIELKKGIVYLYATNKLKKEKLYNIRVIGKSYNHKTSELIYTTKFVIYLFLL